MAYRFNCKICNDRLSAKDAGNMKNVMRTHVLTGKCKKATKEQKEFWRDTP